MKIKYRISLLMIFMTIAIILLLNYSYVRMVIWAADEFIARYLRHQMTSIFVDVPPDSEIDWVEIQDQSDRAVSGADELLYVAVYNANTLESKIISMEVDKIIPLLEDNRGLKKPQDILAALRQDEVNIQDAREIEVLAKPDDPDSDPLLIVIGYIFPISDRVRSFIIGLAIILIIIFSVIAIVSSFLLAGGITKPISRLASAMQRVSDGNLDIAIKVRRRDEVGQLARSFNKMIYQLKEKTSELEQLNATLEDRVRQGVAEIAKRDEEERLRLIREIQRAREVQMGLFPQSPPQIPGLDIYGLCRPASEVGGDFFDYLHLGENRLCLALGDVSGKGLKGAMNAVMAHGMLHTQTRIYSSTTTIISELNTILSARLGEATFTALSLGIIDIPSREINMCNVGNPYPILLRDGKASLLELSGMPLGILLEIEYDEMKLWLKPGDVVIFYSDGISEATRSDEKMYGMESLRKLVESFSPDMKAQDMVERIIQDVKGFVGNFPQSDDMTVIVLRVQR
jgi:serine phosphatase RsbU (regulator of sigma subunit)